MSHANTFSVSRWYPVAVLLIALCASLACSDDKSTDPVTTLTKPDCPRTAHTRTDAHQPQVMVSDWGPPVRLGDSINTCCPEDAIAVSPDGRFLYFLFTTDVVDSLNPDAILARQNNTYRAERQGGPAEFGNIAFFDLGKGTAGSMDAELSFSPGGDRLYFHSNRPENTGYQNDPFYNDFLDIYVANLSGGVPGPARNLGPPVNSVWPDGEHALHPDGRTLYFTSLRPDGNDGADIFSSEFDGNSWSTPEKLPAPINSNADDLQPTFSADGDTMYFTSERGVIGAAIYRSVRNEGEWGEAELVIKGIVGEPALTADGQLLYFVHVLSDQNGTFDADIWLTQRTE